MSMKEWAKREVELACKRENPNRKDGEFDYGCACYESALKAFDSLLEDGHSGFSIGLTKRILNRLIDGKVLTPIEDTDDIWNYTFERGDGTKVYQCKRMYSFFKDVHPDGSVTFSDNDRFYCVNVDLPNVAYHSALVLNVMNEAFPITMPYMPPEKEIKVICEEFLTDRKYGDFDTVGILYYKDWDGKRIDIQRYFKEGGNTYGCWGEIDKTEYEKRRAMHNERIIKENTDAEH